MVTAPRKADISGPRTDMSFCELYIPYKADILHFPSNMNVSKLKEMKTKEISLREFPHVAASSPICSYL